MLLSSGTQAIGVQRLFENWLLDIVLRSQLNYCIKKKRRKVKCVVKCNIFCQHNQDKWQMNGDQVSFQNTLPILSISTYVTKELNIGRLSPEWRPSAISKYSTKFIYFHTGHKRTENWKAFTWMATKCLFNILYQFYLFPHRSQKNWNLECFHLNGDQLPFLNTLPN